MGRFVVGWLISTQIWTADKTGGGEERGVSVKGAQERKKRRKDEGGEKQMDAPELNSVEMDTSVVRKMSGGGEKGENERIL